MSDPDDDLVLDLETAAVGAGVGVSTIRRWITAGKLKPERRRPTLVRLTAVEQLRDQHRHTSRQNLRGGSTD